MCSFSCNNLRPQYYAKLISSTGDTLLLASLIYDYSESPFSQHLVVNLSC